MPRRAVVRPKKASSVAERALAAAIAEETSAIRLELVGAHETIRRLKAVLAGIETTAARAKDGIAGGKIVVPGITTAGVSPELARMLEEARVPAQGVSGAAEELNPVELADEDNMGDGRWA